MGSSQTWVERLSFPCLMVKLRLRETRRPYMSSLLAWNNPRPKEEM